MFDLPIHPKLVHLPLGVAILMPLVIAGILVAWHRGVLPRKTLFVAIAMQLFVAGGAFVALETGEDEEERVEVVVPDGNIEDHEEAAKRFLASSFGVLVILAASALVKRDDLAKRLAGLGVIGALGSTFLAIDAGKTGGELVYRYGAADVYTRSPATGTATPNAPTNDDD